MDGKSNNRNSVDRPIRMPSYPLPGIFLPSKASEAPTKRNTSVSERAHFYKKGISESGAPIYSFQIIQEDRGA